MSRSYLTGILIVAGTLLAAAILASRIPPRVETPVSEDLDRVPYPLGPFRLVDQTGQTVTDADMADRVWIAAFTFTRCTVSCPVVSGVLKGMQRELEGSDVQLVSLSVDPKHDTPEVLADFAKRYDAKPGRWVFLTGEPDAVYELVRGGFKQPAEPNPGGDSATTPPGVEAVMHRTDLALVDRGNRVVGFFESKDKAAVARLLARANRLDRAWVGRLPAVNASLNASCAILLMLGWVSIRARRIRLHTACMIAAIGVSAVFLACYLVYHYMVGSVSFRGAGALRSIYFTILLSHTVLAVVDLPLIILTVVRAATKRWDKHVAIARVAFPIWLYVSITGVVVYLMLYQLDVGPTLTVR